MGVRGRIKVRKSYAEKVAGEERRRARGYLKEKKEQKLYVHGERWAGNHPEPTIRMMEEDEERRAFFNLLLERGMFRILDRIEEAGR